MSQQVSPRGTYLKIVDAIKGQIADDPNMHELPSAVHVMETHGVSRGVALRAFNALREQGVAEPVPGARWRVVRDGEPTDRRPLADRIAAVITEDGLSVGAKFPSATALCARFDVSRPTVRRALDQLEAKGLLSAGSQGKARTVRAVPNREEPDRS
ncbi:GntR family transcriptional regulator [Streptomyces sp. NPDC050504]|uniref:GntR family transcriptional regulator n=1 Tax=Streptomyces sp. NPDC050504 TaxID=3365618 RepID=UPI00378A2D87